MTKSDRSKSIGTQSINSDTLLQRNALWAVTQGCATDKIFEQRNQKHNPGYLWIGCSDARVGPSIITDTDVGEIFVHRNVGNIALETDTNVQAVLTYAIQHLKIDHVIVAGHYDCGAVKATFSHGEGNGGDALDKWLAPLKAIYQKYRQELQDTQNAHGILQAQNHLAELNVLAQRQYILRSKPALWASKNGRLLSISAWIYNPKKGILKDLLKKR